MQKHLFSLKKKLNFRQKPLLPGQVIAIVGSVILLMLISAVVANENRPWTVRLDNRVIAVVADKKAAQAAVAEWLGERERNLGQLVNVEGRITFERARRADGAVVDIATFKNVLSREVTVYTRATAIFVNGKKTLVVSDQETAEKLLTSLQEQYTQNSFDRVAFAEDVQLKTIAACADEILTFQEARERIEKGTSKEQTYTIKEGDTLWDIANTARMDLEKLLAINPGLSPDRLQVGQTIYLSEHSPLINVIVTNHLTVKEEIPFPVEEKEEQSLYKGQQRVVQEGKPGEKEVTYEVTYRNGLEKSREVLQEEILKEPTPKVVAKGTRLLLASRSGSSGRLGWPVAGSIISPFGYRGREFHAGIDVAAGTGASVVAAESGRVSRAGWYGGYGKCVDINHGSGVMTRYAHLSTIAVEVGEQVSRGQLIGRVGSTGNATGPHLHFEVIVNGRPLNPVQFL